MHTPRAGVEPARALAVFIVWAVAATVVLAVARWTELGPPVIALSDAHGIHAGDAAVGIVAIAAAGVASFRLFRKA